MVMPGALLTAVRVRRLAACIHATLTAATLLSVCPPADAAMTPVESIAELSLRELSALEVTSVSKTAELLSAAPAAIYVITHDEIARSGATSIPEALRLAPNLQITQFSSSRYVAGARGLAGAEEMQNFSNKLLILIDGRSVYSPLYSGVYLDVQDVLLEDIERIEVISGPGATLWGANAMHGVINIITRPAYLSDGTLVSAGFGDREQSVSARYGAPLSEQAAFRVYGKAFQRDEMKLAGGGGAADDWSKVQGGARFDWTGAADSVTAQGDLYRGWEGQREMHDVRVQGGNLLGRWQHRTDASDTQIQFYFDQTARAEPADGAAFLLRTYDVELQQSRTLDRRHRLVYGVGGRLHRYDITNGAGLLFEPSDRTLRLANAFLQDTIELTDAVRLTLGLKLENDPFSQWEALPDARLAWQISARALAWASASRAIRAATPFDRDVVEKLGPTVFLTGNRDFDAEQVDAFEIGFRVQPVTNVSFSTSVFYNVYDDLRTIEPASSAAFLPLHWGNRMEGHTYGVEAWAKWQIASWWRLAPGFRWLHKELEFSSGASELLGLAQAGNDPKTQAVLTSSMDLGADVTLDATLRYVDSLPEPRLSSYYDMSASVQWHLSRAMEVSLTGFNLLDANHLEYPAPGGERIRRSVIAQARWRF